MSRHSQPPATFDQERVTLSHGAGRRAAWIGEVVEDAHALVRIDTALGGSRVVDWLSGEQLPRIG